MPDSVQVDSEVRVAVDEALAQLPVPEASDCEHGLGEAGFK